MAKPFSAPMAAEMDLGPGYTLRLSAVDPTTGDVISAIQVANLVMLVDTGAGTTVTDLGFGDFQLVPGPGA